MMNMQQMMKQAQKLQDLLREPTRLDMLQSQVITLEQQ